MATREINVDREGLLDFRLRVQLDGQTFAVALRWNPRALAWIIAVHTADGVPIREGAQLVANWPILRFADRLIAPLGTLATWSSTREEAAVDTLGRAVLLLYQEAATA